MSVVQGEEDVLLAQTSMSSSDVSDSNQLCKGEILSGQSNQPDIINNKSESCDTNKVSDLHQSDYQLSDKSECDNPQLFETGQHNALPFAGGGGLQQDTTLRTGEGGAEWTCASTTVCSLPVVSSVRNNDNVNIESINSNTGNYYENVNQDIYKGASDDTSKCVGGQTSVVHFYDSEKGESTASRMDENLGSTNQGTDGNRGGSPAKVVTSMEFIGPVKPVDRSSGDAYSGPSQQNAGYSEAPLEYDASASTSTQMEAGIDSVGYNTCTHDLSYALSATSVPQFHCEARKEYQFSRKDNFLRGCKWSPDGSRIITNSNDNRIRLYHLESPADSDMSPVHVMNEGKQIYDFAWVPQMSDSPRFACTCSGIPIHLWNSNTGKMEASYRAYDQNDEITAATSLGFSLDGTKLYAGYERTIRVFDTEYGVRPSRTMKTFDKKKKDGQSGIISCFAFSPDNSGLYVAGSYSRHVGIYDSSFDRMICLMEGQRGGVTHLAFSPDGTKLYSGGRKDAEIICWDMRNTGRILYSVLRDVKTNQRMYFDISQSGRYLTSGNNDGSVMFWDTFSTDYEDVNGEMFLKPCLQYQAHRDCVNGISLNHKHGILATASGQRHFQNFHNYGASESDEEMDTDDVAATEIDFSLKLWTLPRSEIG